MKHLYLGSIDLSKVDKSKLFEKDGRKMLDITIWIDDNPDEDWKAMSIQQSTKKGEQKIYVGNAKKWQSFEEGGKKPQDDTPF